MSNHKAIQQAQQLAQQGDKNAAGRLLKRQLDQNFKDTAAWELLYELFGGERSFPAFQQLFVQKYYPQYSMAVPFCPCCYQAYSKGSEFCGSCGYGLNNQTLKFHKTVNAPASRVAPAPTGKSKNPLWWTLGLGLLGIYLLNSAVNSSGESFDVGELIFWGFLSLWVSSGYVGMVWLVRRGYMTELLGCMFMAGGAPLWFPAFFGPVILIIAYFLPLYPPRQAAKG